MDTIMARFNATKIYDPAPGAYLALAQRVRVRWPEPADVKPAHLPARRPVRQLITSSPAATCATSSRSAPASSARATPAIRFGSIRTTTTCATAMATMGSSTTTSPSTRSKHASTSIGAPLVGTGPPTATAAFSIPCWPVRWHSGGDPGSRPPCSSSTFSASVSGRSPWRPGSAGSV